MVDVALLFTPGGVWRGLPLPRFVQSLTRTMAGASTGASVSGDLRTAAAAGCAFLLALAVILSAFLAALLAFLAARSSSGVAVVAIGGGRFRKGGPALAAAIRASVE